MAEEQVLFLNADNVYGADELGLPYRDLVAEGVVGSGDFAVTQRAAGANMSVDVAAGACWIKGDDDADLQPTYRYREPAVTNVSITAADPTDPRIDRIVAEVLDDTFSGVSKLGRIRAVAGTPTTGATLTNLSGAAAVPNTALLLANVLVPAGGTAVDNAEISDKRVRAASGLPLQAARIFGSASFSSASGETTLPVSSVSDPTGIGTDTGDDFVIAKAGTYLLFPAMNSVNMNSGTTASMTVRLNPAGANTAVAITAPSADLDSAGAQRSLGGVPAVQTLVAGDVLRLRGQHDEGVSRLVEGVLVLLKIA